MFDVDHAAGVAGDAAVGEEVGRVGEDQVDRGFGDEGEEVEAVALVDAEVMLFVVEGRSREVRHFCKTKRDPSSRCKKRDARSG